MHGYSKIRLNEIKWTCRDANSDQNPEKTWAKVEPSRSHSWTEWKQMLNNSKVLTARLLTSLRGWVSLFVIQNSWGLRMWCRFVGAASPRCTASETFSLLPATTHLSVSTKSPGRYTTFRSEQSASCNHSSKNNLQPPKNYSPWCENSGPFLSWTDTYMHEMNRWTLPTKMSSLGERLVCAM